jgi:acetyl coenzyme A synthetase (ADP forming)-like protein
MSASVLGRAAYPAHLERDVVLRNGRTLRLRPVRHEDGDRLLAFYGALSPRTMHARFFDMRSADAAMDSSLVDVDYARNFGVVGELNGDIVAIAHYFRLQRPDVAEVAFTIRDEWQGCGLGTHLLVILASVARTNNIHRFVAEVLPDNQPMLDVFLGIGFDVVTKASDGVIHLSFPIGETPRSAQRAAERSQKAASSSMRPIFAPQSIAVVGASRRKGNLGNQILRNLRGTGFQGAIFAVNPNATWIESVPSYASLREFPAPIDLAIVAVPAAEVEKVVDDCVAMNVAAVVIISAGFAETGEEGRATEQRILQKARAAGVRVVGPNCMGVINTDPMVQMHATFAAVFPPAGNIGMSTQSGALGLAILDYARQLNIGFSTFISVGNKVDVSGNDLIQYWAEDPRTDVILLYLESFGNPRKFAQIAARVGKTKPIVVVKSGRSAAGSRAASSHTGAMATDDAIVADMLRQAGVIRTDTLEELFDVAALLANQPLPRGRRVAIVTNAGGPAILAADACAANGLELAVLSAETAKTLREILPAAASFANPIDMIASATADQYSKVLRAVCADPAVDSVITIYIPVLITDASLVADAIREGVASGGKTVLATFMSAQGVPEHLTPIPSFPFPERAVHALAYATSYAEWRVKPSGKHLHFDDVEAPRLRAIVERTLAQGGGWFHPLDWRDLLTAAHVPVAAMAFVSNREDAVDAAMVLDFPVALKAHGSGLLHKSDRGAVILGLTNVPAVHDAYGELQEKLGESMTGAIVQKMVHGGVEVMVGATADPSFGHVMAFGAGGTLVELLADVAFRIHPLTDADVNDLVQQTRVSKLLGGVRGAAPSDIAALKEIIGRLSVLLEICPEIRELDINPLIVSTSGATALDARIRVEPIALDPPSRRVTY